MIELAEKTNTHLEDWDGGQATISPRGQILDPNTELRVSQFVWNTINEAFEYSEKHGRRIPADCSLLDFFREKLDQSDFSPSDKALCLESCKLWGTYMGEPIWKQSLRFFRLEQCIDGSTLLISGDYCGLVR